MMIYRCSTCQHCFYKNDNEIYCQISCALIPQKETCGDWEEDVFLQFLRRHGGETNL